MYNDRLYNNWLKMIITILCVVMISIPVCFNFYETETNDMDADASTDYEMDNYKSVRARNTRAGEDWPGIWTMKAPMPTERYGLAVCTLNDKVYAIGGTYGSGSLEIVEEYDPIIDSWSSKASTNYGHSWSGAAVVNNKIYVIGGANTDAVEEYDSTLDTWTLKNPMPIIRRHFAVGVVNNKIYLFGGMDDPPIGDDKYVPYSSVLEYDPITDTWTNKTPMITPRHELAAGVVDNKIYTFGGHNERNETEVYDPATNNWTVKSPMPTGRGYHEVGVINNELYAIGGYGSIADNVVEKYNPNTDEWVSLPDMPTGRNAHGVAIVDQVIYVIGGRKGSGPGESTLGVNEGLVINGAVGDFDNDGLTNIQEIGNGTDPHNNDTDGDNLGDGFELTFSNTDPTNWDTNGNSIGDGLEFIQNQGYIGGMQSLPNDWIGMTITWDNYTIFIKTNSSVLEGEFDKTDKKLTIKVSGAKGTTGVTEIDIPKSLCKPENITVKFDGGLINYSLTQNATHYHIHIEYNHSVHELMTDFNYKGKKPVVPIDPTVDEPVEGTDEDELSSYIYIIALIIIVIIIIILIVVIRTRNNKVTNNVPDLPPQQLSKMLDEKHAKGEMTEETYNDIRSKLKKYQDQ